MSEPYRPSARFDEREYGSQTVRDLPVTRREFRRVWPWLKVAADMNGNTNTMDGVWARIADGECQLWTDKAAAVVTSLDTYRDTGLREVRCWLAGGKMAGARRIERQITEWAEALGVDRILITGRRGWLRALRGYGETQTVMVKELRRGQAY